MARAALKKGAVRSFVSILALLAACASRPLPTNPAELYVRAARDAYEEAHAKLNQFLLGHEFTSLDAEVWGPIKLPESERRAIAALGDKGATWAADALRLEPHNAAAHLYRSLNLGMAALGRSKTEALLDGLPMGIQRHYERALALDRRAVAALWAKGKFLSFAPWPFRDREEAEKALVRADTLASHPQGKLLLGDLYHLEGREDDAELAWRDVLLLPPAGSTELDRQIRELARRRLRFLH